MLYASTRNSLIKGLGSTVFTDTIFATSKDDLTPTAYAAHKRHIAAPQPMSAREKDMADVKAAERQSTTYEGSRARQNHIGTPIGMQWPQDVEDAVKELAGLSQDRLIVLVRSLQSFSNVGVVSLTVIRLHIRILMPRQKTWSCPRIFNVALMNWAPTCHPLNLVCRPSYPPDPILTTALYPRLRVLRLYQALEDRSVLTSTSCTDSILTTSSVFIYSCPSGSPVKHRMIYSSGTQPLYHVSKQYIPADILATRKIETSDPSELNEAYLQFELGHTPSVDQVRSATSIPGTPPVQDQPKGFARPKGPPRRR